MDNSNEVIGRLVLKSKSQGYITPSDIFEGHKLSSSEIHDIVATILHNEAKSKLLSYGLIEREKVNGVYPLTQRGRHFQSFEKEDKIEKREAFMKSNAYIRAKYWWVFTIAGFLLGSIVTPILLEEWKTIRQSTPKEETIKMSQERKASDTSKHR